MKKLITASVLCLLLACTPGQREAARTVLSIADSLCLVAHQALPDVEALQACNIAHPFIDPAKQLLAGARVEVAGARLAGCGGRDAGAP